MVYSIKRWFERIRELCIAGHPPNLNYLAIVAKWIVLRLLKHGKDVTRSKYDVSASKKVSIVKLISGVLSTDEIKILRPRFRSTDDYVRCVEIFYLLGGALRVYGIKAGERCPFNKLGVRGPSAVHRAAHHNAEYDSVLKSSEWLKEKSGM